MLGSITYGKCMDWQFRKVCRSVGVTPDRKRGNELRRFPIEKARLRLIWIPIFVGAATLVAWGWVLGANVNLAGPLVISFICGCGLSGAMAMTNTLLVDLYPQSPATVIGSLNLCRCLIAAAGTSVVQFMIDAWGLGFCYTFIGLLLAVSSPLMQVVIRWGPKWREARYVRMQQKEQQRERKKEERVQQRR